MKKIFLGLFSLAILSACASTTNPTSQVQQDNAGDRSTASCMTGGPGLKDCGAKGTFYKPSHGEIHRNL